MSNEAILESTPNPSVSASGAGEPFLFEGAALVNSAERVRSCSMRDLVEIIETLIAVRNILWAARERSVFCAGEDALTPGGQWVNEMSDWFEGLIDTIQVCVRDAKPMTSEEAKMKTFALLTYLTPLLDDLHEISILTAEGIREISRLEFKEHHSG